ncbi:MAG TPA: hypothetical protein VL173_18305 [Vicinamibacterales bacterium]|jgi:hypothetical protein|nr:hypothetical protein [Vicinamibacterales bacterium]
MPQTQLISLLGWTPRVQAFMGSRVLECGCVTGTYDTWRKERVEVIDWRSDRCTNDEHRENRVLDGPAEAAHYGQT